MRYTNIQLLRVAAAVGVVLHHLGEFAVYHFGLPGGPLWPIQLLVIKGFPVPLFFAVSGFVLTQALQTAPPGRFLFARFLRLYPGYWLALLATVLMMRLRLVTEHHRWLIYFVGRDAITLWPAGPGRTLYLLGGIEWSLIYEVFLSVSLCGLSLFGRRGLVAAAGVWLAVLAAKMVVYPGYGTEAIPHWSTIWLSVYSVPFLLGVLTYWVKDYGHRFRWLVLAAVGVLLAYTPYRFTAVEPHWCNWGVAAAGVVWLAVRFPQVAERNPVARLGDCTYGLFLFHAPVLLVGFHVLRRFGWLEGRYEAVWLVGGLALVAGLLFGRVESALHAKLRPLAKLTRADVTAWGRRATARVRQVTRLPAIR